MRAGQFIIDPDTGAPVTPSAWQLAIGGLAHAAVERVVEVDWTGDDSNDRLIDMGIECDFVIIVSRDSFDSTTAHLALAYAIGIIYGAFIEVAATGDTRHGSMAAVDLFWQGIQVGTDNILLGDTGTDPSGTNASGALYRAIGFKFRDYP